MCAMKLVDHRAEGLLLLEGIFGFWPIQTGNSRYPYRADFTLGKRFLATINLNCEKETEKKNNAVK